LGVQISAYTTGYYYILYIISACNIQPILAHFVSYAAREIMW